MYSNSKFLHDNKAIISEFMEYFKNKYCQKTNSWSSYFVLILNNRDSIFYYNTTTSIIYVYIVITVVNLDCLNKQINEINCRNKCVLIFFVSLESCISLLVGDVVSSLGPDLRSLFEISRFKTLKFMTNQNAVFQYLTNFDFRRI